MYSLKGFKFMQEEDSKPKFKIPDSVYVFVAILIAIPIFQSYLAEFLAKKYAREHTHIQDSCLYFSHFARSKISNAPITHVIIGDDWRARNLEEIKIPNTPYSSKSFARGKSWNDFIRKVENERGKCHRVKAIKIDFVFIKRFFIYDYY